MTIETMKNYVKALMDDAMLSRVASIITFCTEALGYGNLPYKRVGGGWGNGFTCDDWNFNKNVRPTRWLCYRELSYVPILCFEVEATEENIKRFSGKIVKETFRYPCLYDLVDEWSLYMDGIQSLVGKYGINLRRVKNPDHLPLLINLNQRVNRVREYKEVKPEITTIGRFWRKRRIITRQKYRKIKTETYPAFSDEVINTSVREPLYVNEFGAVLPHLYGRRLGTGRFLIFHLYTPESTDKLFRGDHRKSKQLLFGFYSEIFPELYEATQEVLREVGTSLEKLPSFYYNPKNREFFPIQ